MKLLPLITWPYLRKHKLRTLLTMAGIMIGVAVFVGMHTANQSVLFAFNKTIDQIAGSTQLQVTAGENGFAESVLERVRAVEGVRVAVPVIENVLNIDQSGQGNLLILGVDMLDDRGVRDYKLDQNGEDYIADPLLFLAQNDSLLVTRTFASTNHLQLNSKVTLQSIDGPRQFTVRGIMETGGLTSAFGGNLAVMDIYAAQKLFGLGPRYDRIDVALQEGATLDTVQARLRQALGPTFEVDPPAARGQQFEAVAQVYATTATLSSLFALVIGMFLIYQTFSVAVMHRRSEIGVLRALGATAGQIRNLFLMECAVIGLFASLAGCAVGLLIAQGLTQYLSKFLTEIYGIVQRAQDVTIPPSLLIAAVVLGVLTSIIAGWIPARQAAQVDPVQALQKGRLQQFTAGENRRRRHVAVGLAAAFMFCLLMQRIAAFFYLGAILAIIAAILLVPALSLMVARLLRPVLRAIQPVEGTLAIDSLIQAPRRTSGVVAALMLSLALVISLGGMSQASYQSIKTWIGVALNPDLFVTPSETVTNRTFRFPSQLGDEIAKIDSVREVQRIRFIRTTWHNNPVMLLGVDLGSLGRTSHLPPTQGNREEMYRLADAGKGFLVSDNYATLRHIKLGQMMEFATPKGELKLPVVGVVQDYSDQLGTVIMSRMLYRQYWDDDTVNVIRVFLKPGVKPEDAKRAIFQKIGPGKRLFILTNEQLRSYVLNMAQQWYGITYVQIFVAVLVAILGIVNSLTVSITDRRRELGVLQAVGAMRQQIRKTIWLEAASVAIIGVALGLLLGAVQLYYALELGQRDLGGFRLSYEYPVGIALLLFPLLIAVAWLSAVGPAESAVRGSLVEALEYE